jgi:predicted tellurium resistance membrane protein TerC
MDSLATFASPLADAVPTLLLLIGLELVLGVDNVLVFSILRNTALKILALAFLITIGVTIFMEGVHQHVEKAYIYLPMGFALAVELLQMRHSRNVQRLQGLPGDG